MVEAALEGSREKALAALSSDPTVGGEDIAAKLLDDLIRATATWLPQFSQMRNGCKQHEGPQPWPAGAGAIAASIE